MKRQLRGGIAERAIPFADPNDLNGDGCPGRKLAAEVAAAIVSQFGPRLSVADYQAIRAKTL